MTSHRDISRPQKVSAGFYDKPTSRRALLRSALKTAASAMVAGFFPGLEASQATAPSQDQEIWDGHVHLAWMNGSVAQRIDTLLSYADRMGIRRMVVSMGTTLSKDPDPDEFRRQNDEVLQAIAHAPDRVFGMVYLNPKYPEESLRELDRCVTAGPMIGVKLWIALPCSRPELDPIAHRAARLKAPIFQHTYFRCGGNLPGESTPADLATLAQRHSDAVFICGHTGNDWERGIRAIRAMRNVYADLSGFDPTSGVVEMAVRELGADRVVFGSDAPGRSFASQMAKVLSADIPEEAKQSILKGNLGRLLEPILARKRNIPK